VLALRASCNAPAAASDTVCDTLADPHRFLNSAVKLSRTVAE
jgi:hypothetical protein